MHLVLIKFKPVVGEPRDVALVRDMSSAKRLAENLAKAHPSYLAGEFSFSRTKFIKTV